MEDAVNDTLLSSAEEEEIIARAAAVLGNDVKNRCHLCLFKIQ
jgi:hypothetical protein